jgi:type II secretory pathway pseudopilin PulG
VISDEHIKVVCIHPRFIIARMYAHRKSNVALKSQGFALVITLLLMVLLGLLCLGMLSLSSISLRSSVQNSDVSEARANARMALMLAIGELQRQTGPDTRVTAQAVFVDPSAPPLTGVWKSWEGEDHDSTGRPIKPDYASKTESARQAGGRFLTWLVSGAGEADGTGIPSPGDLLSSTPGANTIPLLAERTLGGKPGQVHVEPRLMMEETGAYAWWVSPENQKARLLQPHQPRTNDIAGWVEAGQSHLVPDPGVFGLEALADDPEEYLPDPAIAKLASRALSLKTTELLIANNPKNPQQSFHDLSTSSVGLLTNTATGGWRKDLSILTEKWDDIYSSYPGGKLPLFRFTPDEGATSQVPKPTANNYKPSQCTLYPWSEYSVILGNERPATLHAAAASWQALQSFATSYRNFSYSAGAAETPFVWDAISKGGNYRGEDPPTNQEFYNYKHKQRLYPQIARFQFLLYAKAIEDPARLNQNPTRYQLMLNYVPVLTMWNPFNVRLTIDNPGPPTSGIVAGIRRGLPGALAIESQTQYPDPDTVPGNRFRLISNGNFQYLDVARNWGGEYDTYLQENIDLFNPGGTRANSWVDMRTMGLNFPTGQITFEPGEVIMYSPDGRVDRRFGGTAFGMEEGYRPENVEGWSFANSSNLTEDRRFWFLLRTDKYTQPYRNRKPGVGFSLSYGIATGGSYTQGDIYSGVSNEYHNITSLIDGDLAAKYWPQSEVDEVGYSVAELASGPWLPLFSISQGPRISIGTGVGTPQNRPTKGVVQNDALASIALIDPAWDNSLAHPANGTFEMSYHSMSLGSTITPGLSNSEGFIATGYQSGDGLTRLIMDEIPLRPMASLVELQGWNPRGHNPYPPFQMNLIGNSDATPLIPMDDVVPLTLNPSGDSFNLQHDDAYCANHLLFDDWFVSSVAPEPVVLGGNIARSIDTVYKDYLMGENRLSNRSYQPIADDSEVSDSVATTRVAQVVNSADGWLKVASRFQVEGMFNVNSTSVEAWKAILGHAKSREEIGMHGENGIESVVATNDHPVTRGAVATDVEAGAGAAIGGGAPNASEYTGFKSLTDADIGDLAEKIVEQVRLRGPFLSLSEFVNRQLSGNEDLAMAGALQTAINNLDNDPMAELRDPVNSLSDNTMPANDRKLDGADYAFAAAAEGDSAYGAPGWIRQADILRPIAPILSARDDTFTIRAYGDARDNKGKVVASAWCEATVQRSRDFVDSEDQADSFGAPTSEMNQIFGRKYVVKTFRWLNADEV